METLNKNYEWNKQLDTQVSNDLAQIFWITKGRVSELITQNDTQNETQNAADSNEVNYKESQLADVFGKKEDMLKLNESNKQSDKPLSLASVMADFEEFEHAHAA